MKHKTKKNYQKPILTNFGKVQQITLSAGTIGSDGMTGMNMEFEF